MVFDPSHGWCQRYLPMDYGRNLAHIMMSFQETYPGRVSGDFVDTIGDG